MKTIYKAALIALVLFAQACIIVSDDDASLTVINDSDYLIYELYVAPIDSSFWGENLLAGDVLVPDSRITIYDLSCDYYDVLAVDEFETDCILEDIYLCLDDDAWVIDNTTLAICDAFGSI